MLLEAFGSSRTEVTSTDSPCVGSSTDLCCLWLPDAAWCQPGGETKSSGAPAPWYKGQCNLLPVGILSSLWRNEYIYINEVNRKIQIIASELANGHVKDDENKSRTDFLLPVSCFCYLKKSLVLLKVQSLLPTLSIFLTRINYLLLPVWPNISSYIGF